MTNFAHLTIDEAHSLLEAGQTVQQWIAAREEHGFRFIRWVSVQRCADQWQVFEKDALDDSRAGNIDLSACYNCLDPDAPEGVRYECNSAESALTKCVALGCSRDAFVRFNQIQRVYDAYRAAHGPPAKAAAEYFTLG